MNATTAGVDLRAMLAQDHPGAKCRRQPKRRWRRAGVAPPDPFSDVLPAGSDPRRPRQARAHSAGRNQTVGSSLADRRIAVGRCRHLPADSVCVTISSTSAYNRWRRSRIATHVAAENMSLARRCRCTAVSTIDYPTERTARAGSCILPRLEVTVVSADGCVSATPRQTSACGVQRARRDACAEQAQGRGDRPLPGCVPASAFN